VKAISIRYYCSHSHHYHLLPNMFVLHESPRHRCLLRPVPSARCTLPSGSTPACNKTCETGPSPQGFGGLTGSRKCAPKQESDRLSTSGENIYTRAGRNNKSRRVTLHSHSHSHQSVPHPILSPHNRTHLLEPSSPHWGREFKRACSKEGPPNRRMRHGPSLRRPIRYDRELIEASDSIRLPIYAQ